MARSWWLKMCAKPDVSSGRTDVRTGNWRKGGRISIAFMVTVDWKDVQMVFQGIEDSALVPTIARRIKKQIKHFSGIGSLCPFHVTRSTRSNPWMDASRKGGGG